MRALTFDNRFVSELPGDNGAPLTPRQVTGACWSHATPTPVSAPKLVAHSREVAELLGFSAADARGHEFYWDHDGIAMWSKRLLDGIELADARRRPMGAGEESVRDQEFRPPRLA